MALETLSLQLEPLRMQVLAAGPADGPPVVLLHGFPELSVSWAEVLPLLAAAGFRAYAPDLRGYGGTDVPAHGYDIDTLAGDVAALIRHVSPSGPAHVVGHDWGGAIAYHLAAHTPAVVRRLAVVNCPHPAVMARRIWRPDQLRRSWYMFFFQLPWLPELLLSRRRGEAVRQAIRRALTREARARIPDARLQPYADAFARKDVAHAAVAYYRAALRKRMTPWGFLKMDGYPKIQAPFRLLWGDQDVALGNHLARDLDGWFEHRPDVVFLEGVGHFAPLEQPEWVARLLVEHLQGAAA
jgi:epoxide hydrolase 4